MDIIGNFLLISSIAESEAASGQLKGFGFNSNILEANVINIVILASGVFYLGRSFLTSALELRQQKITEAIQEAEERLQQASSRLAESEKQMAQAKIVIEQIKKEALATPLQGIIAALEGMKIRKERTFIFRDLSCPKVLILGQKDPVLNYEENHTQIKNTDVQLITFPDGHMSHIENREALQNGLLHFLNGL
jgi:pimeloyl-ACP methyl ester carboxylesterase